jgi:glycerophosphoryl diester phosphodiesterase
MHFKISFIILLFLFFSCKKEGDFSATQIFGHAGNGLNISNSIYHDNTKNSVDLALSQNGCDGVEVDVQISKDGTCWLFHDPILQDESDGHGCLNSKSDEEIAKYHYKTLKSEKLSKLSDLEMNGKSLFLDLRHSNLCENKLVDVNLLKAEMTKLKENNPLSKVYLNTGYQPWLHELKSLNLEIVYSPTKVENVEEIAITYDVKSFIYKNQEIEKSQVEYLQNKGYSIFIFEVRSPKGIRSAFKKKPFCIISNDVKATIVEKY